MTADDPRYARQRILREFGPDGQARLAGARVLCVGAGGLGAPVALYLAAAGVGTLGLVDRDVVEASNLHRQLLYGTSDVGRPKLEAAAARLHDVNPLVDVVRHDVRLSADNADALVTGYDVVVDGTDNFPARYAINDACVRAGIPFVYGSVSRFEGQVSLFGAPDGPCYRCLFPEPPAPGTVPSCAEEGVLGVLPGIVGLWQATEAIKWCTGLGQPLAGRLLLYDALAASVREVSVPRDASCPACGAGRSDPSPVTAPPMASAPPTPIELEPAALRARLDVREPWEHRVAALPEARLVPLGTLAEAAASLDPAAEYVVYCHHGGRSAMAVQWLREQGFARTTNLTGGIDAWSLTVDPSVPRY